MHLGRQIEELEACQLLEALQGNKSGGRRTQFQGMLTTSSMEAFSTFWRLAGSDSLIRARIVLDCRRYLYFSHGLETGRVKMFLSRGKSNNLVRTHGSKETLSVLMT